MSSDLQQDVIKIHANRAKALLYAGVAGAFVVIDWLLYVVWPTPEVSSRPWMYQEPFKTGFFIVLLLVMGAGLLACLCLTVTPRPLVQLDSEGMVYELYPFVRRSVHWADVSRISAFKDSYSVSPVQRSMRLTLYFNIKPHGVLAYGGKSKLRWTIGQALLPISVGELVHDMQRYHHEVTLIDPQSLRRLVREHRSSERGEHSNRRG
jgi:hypothetical protein